jgi:hypothetical protein
MPMMAMPKYDFDCWANRFHCQENQKQLVDELALGFLQLVLPSLKEEEAKPPIISLEGYRDPTAPVMDQGLVVVELCGGILSATQALIRR